MNGRSWDAAGSTETSALWVFHLSRMSPSERGKRAGNLRGHCCFSATRAHGGTGATRGGTLGEAAFDEVMGTGTQGGRPELGELVSWIEDTSPQELS